MREQEIAYVNLSTGEVKKKPIPESIRRKYLGGRGIDVYLLYNHITPGTDPLGPENALTVSAGLLGGTLAPSSGRCHIGAKSPLTGLIGSSNMGGFFAPELRFAGIDHLVVTGKADHPVYLWIDNGDIEIRDASKLWGKDTVETPALIRSDLGDEEVKTICIGVGGENLVRFANVISGLKNAAGRTGMGCVMGSKNLKAIAVRGRQDLPIAYTEEALRYLEHLLKLMRENPILQEQSRLGTAMFQMMMDLIGKVRNRNLQRNQLVDGQSLYAENIVKFSTRNGGLLRLSGALPPQIPGARGQIQGPVGRGPGVDHAGRPWFGAGLPPDGSGSRRQLPGEQVRHRLAGFRQHVLLGHRALREGDHRRDNHRRAEAGVGQ